MAIPRHHIGFKGDECQCGRRASLIHCPKCGSAGIRSRHNIKHKHLDGHEDWVEVQLVCNMCGNKFIHDERQWCSATPIGTAAAARKLQILAEAEGNPNNTKDEQTAAITAKQLLDALKQIPASTDAEAKAIERLERQSKTTAMQEYEADREFELAIMQAYADECEEFKKQGKAQDKTMEEFIVMIRGQHNRPKVEKPDDL